MSRTAAAHPPRAAANAGAARRRPRRAAARAAGGRAIGAGYEPKGWTRGLNDRTVEDIRKLRLITAIKTPYQSSGKIDLLHYDRLVEEQIAGGTEGLVVGGTTGEGQLMSWDEHIMLIAHTVHRFGDKIAVIGNTGSNATREAVHATCQGFAVGMHAALHINPYYGKTSEDGLYRHFEEALSYGPSIVYNVAARTAQDITPDIMENLAEHPNFAGIKECAGTERIKHYTDQGIVCWTGNDDEAHQDRYEGGATGVISVTSNVAPKLMHQLMHDGPDADLRDRLLPLMNWLFAEPNPIGLNTLSAMTGMAKPVFRLPYVPYNRELREQGKAILEELGEDSFVHDGPVRVLEDSDFIIVSKY